MITVTDKKICSGCRACLQSCPKHCISMVVDDEGFAYPKVDESKCVNCGLCERKCPFLNPYEEQISPEIYACYNKCESIRMNSSSGGIFSLLAKKILAEKGVVFGARFDDEWQVVLDYTESIEGLIPFMGSKYVQSRTGDAFAQCESFLKKGRKVLFSGVPCQIAGLKHFLRKDYDNLWTCEVICHGSPSPKVWNCFLDTIARNKKDICEINFRDKKDGWKNFNFSIKKIEKIKEFVDHRRHPYMKAFLSDLISRPSCYNCKAKMGKSHSDIALGDFWNVSNLNLGMDDDKGTSMMVVYTQHGKDLVDWDEIQSCLVQTDVAFSMCRGLKSEIKMNEKRKIFFKKMNESPKDIVNLMSEFTKEPMWERLKDKVRPIKNKLFCKAKK